MSALPSAPNSLSINQIAQEYGGDTPHALSEYYGDGDNVLDGAQGDGGAIPESGAISIGDFFGGRDRVVINLTIGSNTQAYQISQQYGGTYEAGFTDIVLTNNAQVGSTAVGTAGIFTGAAPNYASGDTLKIVNAGHIRGRGGNGGAGMLNNGTGVAAGQIAGDAIEMTDFSEMPSRKFHWLFGSSCSSITKAMPCCSSENEETSGMTTASAQVCGGHVATAAHTTSTTRMRALAGAFGCRAARLHDAILALTSLVALPTLRINFV